MAVIRGQKIASSSSHYVGPGRSAHQIIAAQSKFVNPGGVWLFKNLFSSPSLFLKVLSIGGFPSWPLRESPAVETEQL